MLKPDSIKVGCFFNWPSRLALLMLLVLLVLLVRCTSDATAAVILLIASTLRMGCWRDRAGGDGERLRMVRILSVDEKWHAEGRVEARVTVSLRLAP